jgi:N-acetylmuramoyl-L-alanine amidase
MKKKHLWLLLACGVSLAFLLVLRGALVDAAAQMVAVVCFWSAQGPVCVERSVVEESGEALLAVLLAGPTPEEQAQGLWSAIPNGTTLDRVETRSDGTVVVYLRLPQETLGDFDPAAFEIVVRQIGGTLEPLRWSDLRIQTWDANAEAFVPLASFLPETPSLRKEAMVLDEGILPPSIPPIGGDEKGGQPPAFGQGQPQGALSGKTVYVSAGHGWQWNGSAWRTQRPPYPTGGYAGPIIEDHNNAEVVNQYLLQYLWNAGATVIPVRERDLNSAEVIVDNDDPAPGTGYAETGTWTTTVGIGYAGANYRWAETVTGTTTATAAWTATLPADGEYAIYVWYLQSGNRTPDAHYTIHHAGGETTVVVDQRIHGSTWHYIGTYGFLGGEEARVALTNQSSVAETAAVIADAVRFGGGTFDDLYDIETTAEAPPYEPWWEVCTFYYSQRMGLDPDDWPYFNDVVARPMYARWEHADTGEDAVYVSWHTNGASGGYQEHTRGTMSIVYNSEVITKPITAGSVDLRDAIHNELVHDIRAGWDPTWPEYTRSMNLGELRELWDDDPAVRMPGALIEIAFHDHPGDTDALKEPTFEILAARGIYQGIVKYFEGRDSVDLKLLPEPPTHLAVQNVGGGAVRVSWQASPTDAIGLVGDAATGYRVYTSTNGIGWSNGVTVTGTTAYTLTGFVSDQLVFVRVAAVNDGGESFPTEVLAARVGSAGTLIVNGFDRLNRSMMIPETDPTEGYNMRMFLDRMNAYDYVIQHGEAIPYAFDSASNEAVKDGAIGLGQYAILDWIVGEESVSDETLDVTERALLAAYLDGGGALFISGAEIGWHLDYLGGDPAFYTGYLRAGYAGDDAGTYQVAPASGSIFVGLPSFRFDAGGMYDPDYPDQVTPLGGAVSALDYQGGAGGTAAIQYADGCERVINFGFPFETIEPGQRAAVMGRVLDFLDECLAVAVDTDIASPVDGSAHNVLPDFLGTADAGAAALDRVEVQIERDGEYWTESEWVTGTTWLTATGTSVWSYTLPVLSDGDYTLRARAWTTDPYSDTTPAEVVLTYDTVPPTTTSLITPTNGITVSSAADVTLEWEPVDPGGGSPVSYVVKLDGQIVYTTTQTFYAVAQIASGPHTWEVQVIDAAGNASGWTPGDFYVSRHYVWLPLVMREEPEPPGPACTDVIVNGDFESDEGWVLNRLAVYTTTQAHAGARSARVGIPPGEAGGGQTIFSSVMQVVTLTEGSSATLSLWVYPIGEGGDTGDYHYIGVLDSEGVYHGLDHWQSDARDWELHQYDLSTYVDQRVTIYVGTVNDGDDDTATLYVDDVAVEICP